MFTFEVKYIALSVGVLSVSIWGFVGSGWHYAKAAGDANPIRREPNYAQSQTLAAAKKAVPTAVEAAPEVAPEVAESPVATELPAQVEAVEASTPVSVAAVTEEAEATVAPEAEASVTVLDDVFYDAARDALVVPYSGPAPQTSRVNQAGGGLAYIDFTHTRTAFGRPRFKRQTDAAFKSYILNTRPGVDRARLSFVVARPGELQLEAVPGELVVRLGQP